MSTGAGTNGLFHVVEDLTGIRSENSEIYMRSESLLEKICSDLRRLAESKEK